MSLNLTSVKPLNIVGRPLKDVKDDFVHAFPNIVGVARRTQFLANDESVLENRGPLAVAVIGLDGFSRAHHLWTRNFVLPRKSESGHCRRILHPNEDGEGLAGPRYNRTVLGRTPCKQTCWSKWAATSISRLFMAPFGQKRSEEFHHGYDVALSAR